MTNTLAIDAKAGLLKPSTQRCSPHQDDRPANTPIDMIVIHNISLPPADFSTNAVESFFTGTLDNTLHPYYATIAHLRVSAHLFIRRNGEIIQFVPFTKRAWHAGESYFQGKERCNDFAIGIELEGTDTLPYEPIQYEQLIKVIKQLQTAYPEITLDRIVGHVDIAPHRKTDPGPSFDWQYVKGKLI